jgi:hypothetical protein
MLGLLPRRTAIALHVRDTSTGQVHIRRLSLRPYAALYPPMAPASTLSHRTDVPSDHPARLRPSPPSCSPGRSPATLLPCLPSSRQQAPFPCALSSFHSASRANGPSSRLARDLTFDYGSQKVQGVNLGGWFVLGRTLLGERCPRG